MTRRAAEITARSTSWLAALALLACCSTVSSSAPEARMLKRSIDASAHAYHVRQSQSEGASVSERVAIEVSPGGDQTIVRIRSTQYRRLAESVKAVIAAFAAMLFLNLIRPDRWSDPAQLLAFSAATAALIGVMTFLHTGENVVVTSDEVRVVQPLDSFAISRDQQDQPVYSPVPSRIWFSQRWENEHGSGVLLFGDAKHGARFGEDLSAQQAATVLQAFVSGQRATGSARGSESVRASLRFLAPVGVYLAMMAFVVVAVTANIPRVGFIALTGILVLAGFGLLSWIENRFPRRISLG
jgi:hypothetical protein